MAQERGEESNEVKTGSVIKHKNGKVSEEGKVRRTGCSL